VIAVIARVVVSLVLVAAAGAKLFGAGPIPEATLYGAVARGLPAGWQHVLPVVEIALAVLLWVPKVGGLARVATTFMLCCFAGMLVVESGKPAPRRCGCLGRGGAAGGAPRVQNRGGAGLDLLLAAGLNAGRIRGAGASRSGEGGGAGGGVGGGAAAMPGVGG
jgi:hypothetical protein